MTPPPRLKTPDPERTTVSGYSTENSDPTTGESKHERSQHA